MERYIDTAIEEFVFEVSSSCFDVMEGKEFKHPHSTKLKEAIEKDKMEAVEKAKEEWIAKATLEVSDMIAGNPDITASEILSQLFEMEEQYKQDNKI